MAVTENITNIYQGEKGIIKILSARARARRKKDEEAGRVRGMLPEYYDPEFFARPHVSFHDIATRFEHLDPNVRVGWARVLNIGQSSQVTGRADWVNGYAELDLEIQGLFQSELDRARHGYLDRLPFDYSETTLVKRSVPNAYQLHRDCGQLFLDAHMIESASGVDHKYVLQTGQRGWLQRKSAPALREQLQQLSPFVSDRSASADRAQFDTGVMKAMLREDEEANHWLSAEAGLVNKEAMLVPRLAPGAYDIKINSLAYYEPFHTGDLEHFHMTAEPDYNSPAAGLPKITSRARVRIFLVPTYVRVRASWFAWYLFVTSWAFTYVRIPTTMAFHNRMPVFPRPFELGTSDYPPLWYWIERSQAHGRAVAQDLALQFFSPFIAVVFVFTSDGFFEIRATDTFPGMLAGAVEINGVRRYIYRKTVLLRDTTLQLAAGPLQTYWVNSFGASIIGTDLGITT